MCQQRQLAVGCLYWMRCSTLLPDLQSLAAAEEFDVQCEYIHRWIPELRGVSPTRLHRLDKEADTLGIQGYPAPIVEHSQVSQQAKELLRNMPGDSVAWSNNSNHYSNRLFRCRDRHQCRRDATTSLRADLLYRCGWVSSGWAGLAVALGLCWDAVTDPLMGYLSDRWYSHLGGRRPFLLLGGLLLPISVYFLFFPHHFSKLRSQSSLICWWDSLFLNTAMTILSVPHMAMAAEMTTEPNERSALFAIRFACGNIGAILGAGLPGFFASGEG